MTINPKALAPAVLVFRDEHAAYRTYADLRDSEAVSATVNILTAYLAALPAGDEAEVVRRVRAAERRAKELNDRPGVWFAHDEDVFREAADVIERQSATIAQLRGEVERLQRECDQLSNSMGFAELAMESISNAAQAAPDLAGKPESDGWIEWKGGECPVAPTSFVDVKFRGIENLCGIKEANYWNWTHFKVPGDIIAYRVAEQKETQP